MKAKPTLHALLVANALFAAPSIHAADAIWDGGGATAGWGNTGGNTNWVGSVPTFDANLNVIFYAPGAARLENSLGISRTIGSLTFNANADSNVAIRLDDTASSNQELFMGSATVAPTIMVEEGSGGSHTIGSNTLGKVKLLNNLTVSHNGSGILTVGRPIEIAAGMPGLTKSGSGTLVLSGVNTYNGGTSVDAGTLLINGSISTTGAVSVASAATLGGNGTVGGATVFTGASIHAPGNAAATVGNQTFSGSVTYGTGTIFEWDFNSVSSFDPGEGVTNAGTGTYDQVTATGPVTGGAAVFKIVLAAGDSFTDAFWNTDKSWSNIFTGAGAPGNLAALFSSFDATGGLNGSGLVAGQGQFTLSNTTNTLSWTAVPEPGTALAGLLLVAGLLRRRRSQG